MCPPSCTGGCPGARCPDPPQLELTATQRDGVLQGSLLWAIDRTLTAMGGRCLRRWLEALDGLRRHSQASQVVTSRWSNAACGCPCGVCCGRWAISNGWRDAGAGHAGARDLVAIAEKGSSVCRSWRPAGGASVMDPTGSRIATAPCRLAGAGRLDPHTLVEAPPLSLSEGG